jgi:AraC family transcriptional regulator
MEIKLAPGQFYGETSISRVVPGFRLMETTYSPGTRMPRHSHERGCLSVMLKGALTENYRRRSLEWSVQGVGFNPPDEEHWNIVHDKGARFLIVEVGPDWTRRAHDHGLRLGEAVVFRRGMMNWLGFRLYREARQSDGVSALAIEGLALEILAELSRRRANLSKDESPYWLKQARELIHAHFKESLTVSFIAKTVGVHPVHLARVFRRNYHATIGEYVRQLRVESACRDISSTDLPLATIAADAGFYDQGHLSRMVKCFTGMTPAEYRSLSRSR